MIRVKGRTLCRWQNEGEASCSQVVGQIYLIPCVCECVCVEMVYSINIQPLLYLLDEVTFVTLLVEDVSVWVKDELAMEVETATG